MTDFALKTAVAPPKSTTPILRRDLTKAVYAKTNACVGIDILDFEASGTTLSATRIGELKNRYKIFFDWAVNKLTSEGFTAPKNKDDLLNLCDRVLSLVWGKFDNKDTDLLLLGLGKGNSLKKMGTLDCDTSCFVVADILSQFGVSSKLVWLPGHVLLHLGRDNTSIYSKPRK